LSNPGGRRKVISTNKTTASAALAQPPAVLSTTSKTRKKSGFHVPSLVGYVASFALFVGVVAVSYQTPSASKNVQDQAKYTIPGLATVANTDTIENAPSIDDIVANDVAAGITERANLPIAPNIANMSQSLSAKSELAQTDETVIAKPQIIQPTSTNRAVTYYVTKTGDTVQAIATQYNISPDTIKWANNLTSDALAPDQKLTILPVAGVQYTVKAGDTVDSIASKYSVGKERIISYNDLEISGVKEGQNLIIPGGVVPENERPGYVAPRTTRVSGGGVDMGGSRLNTRMRATAGNRYAPGNCTWYAYERRMQLGRPVGSFWGNANTWASSAAAAGYTVNRTPEAGAVLVDRAGFYGHVGVVESVAPNGDIVITEMNNYAYGGFNIVSSRTISAGQAAGYLYIH
jgi:surface antigen